MNEHAAVVPSLFWILPFVTLLLCVALLPLIPRLSHWWEHNSSKLAVASTLAVITCFYYFLRGRGFHDAEAGLPALGAVLNHAMIQDFIPFIILLFSLFTISGGILIETDLPARPFTNGLILLIGTMLASFIGTTGASMLLIRPLLQINRERRHVRHTVIFFIFLVSNIGRLLLPVGDPPLFLGYLRGVPFLWTLRLFREWSFCIVLLMAAYVALDIYYYKKELAAGFIHAHLKKISFSIQGKHNLLLLAGVVLTVGLLVPGQPLSGTEWVVPGIMLREMVLLTLTAVSFMATAPSIREAHGFNFGPIKEVAFLFIGIFITMQVPVEILQLRGPSLRLASPSDFFWASGILSSFLDNAPTYVVFFETAAALPAAAHSALAVPDTATGFISNALLAAVSCGAVMMGANTYIGNGPNFMVKSIAEENGVKMPSFFGYMAYSIIFLIPVFVLVTFVFFR